MKTPKQMKQEFNEMLEQTDFTRTIALTAYDAKMFLGKIETQIEICQMVNKHSEAEHWSTLRDQAKELFKL